MQALTINGLDAAGEYLTGYSLKLDDVDGDDTGTSETGASLVHVVRKDVATIDAKWTNLPATIMEELTEQLAAERVSVGYRFGGESITASMRPTGKQLAMTTPVDGGYWSLSVTLKEY